VGASLDTAHPPSSALNVKTSLLYFPRSNGLNASNDRTESDLLTSGFYGSPGSFLQVRAIFLDSMRPLRLWQRVARIHSSDLQVCAVDSRWEPNWEPTRVAAG
jgi:hypothetical protein